MAIPRNVCIVTDSTADVPRRLVESLNIGVVPLGVAVGGHTFKDGDITMDEFFRRMNAARDLPTTSQPSVGAFLEMFEERLGRYSEIVCVTVSNRLSGTNESAREAAKRMGDRVHVFDSLNLSWGEGYQVVTAARAAAEGATVAEVLARLETVRVKNAMIVGLDSLHNLAKGGRIGKVSAFLGGMLNVRVLLGVDAEGALEPVYRGRGTKAALKATLDWAAERVDRARPAAFGVLHAQSPDRAAWLEEAVRERFTVAELEVIETGPAIATHTGTGWGLTCCQLD